MALLTRKVRILGTMLTTIGLGLVAGGAHVMTGPDHLAAIAPLAVHRPRSAIGIGLKWGVGHGLGAGLVGLLGLVSRGVLRLEVLSAWSELLVGFMLLLIGGWAFVVARGSLVDSPRPQHVGNQPRELSIDVPGQGHSHAHVSLWVGGLHGAAGTGHLLAVIPALALPTGQALLYLGSYFLAAVVAMGMVGALLGWMSCSRSPQVLRAMMYATSGAAMLVGTFWIGVGFLSI